MSEKEKIFSDILKFFGYEKEGTGESYRGVYNNQEKKTKLVLSDTLGAIFCMETGNTLGSITLNEHMEKNFKELASLLYKGY